MFVIWAFVLGEPALFGQGTLESAVPATAAALVTVLGLSYLGYGETFDLDTVRDRARAERERAREQRVTYGND